MFFEMIYETNLFGLLTVFSLGVVVGFLCATGVFKLLQRRAALKQEKLRLQAQVDERNQERVGRLRADRSWDT